MVKKFLPVLFIFMFFSVVYSQPDLPVEELISKGDSAYKALDNRRAAEFYTLATRKDSTNYEATWKLSRAYIDMGETLTNETERARYYKKGEELARKAIQINPNGSKGHLMLSIALGRVALDAGAKERVRLSKEVKAEVDKALELDPNDDIAWHVLGRWHRRISALSWVEKKFADMFLGGVPKEASPEKAAECFQRAIELNPEYINHHLELGITFEEMGKEDLAIQKYKEVLQLPVTDSEDPNHKEEAKKRLDNLT